ncbi:hypothetical protein BA724_03615 [Domibacillus iocasae]|uniref:Uncharacterized protein n=2 Tax=Domibacillus iocasae TaxID=1714016 RepID=A0A1E7DPT6_9BACI|nr:hypothetical protein BA724_03615 [Domibacillus iocasae]
MEGTNMTEKKMTLQEAMMKKLEEKKSQNAGGKANGSFNTSTKKLQSQQTKKVSNSRRKMGV